MRVKDVGEALMIARNFIEWDYRGPYADVGTFEPISAKLSESDKKWMIVCKFEKDGKPYRARIEIDSETGKIVAYELLGT